MLGCNASHGGEFDAAIAGSRCHENWKVGNGVVVDFFLGGEGGYGSLKNRVYES